MNDIFKVEELGVCKNVQMDKKTAFTSFEFKSGDECRNHQLPLHFILFVLEGVLEVSCNQFENRRIKQNQMILFMRASSVSVKAIKKSSIMVMYFDMFLCSCDQHLFKAYLPDIENKTYDFTPVEIPDPVSLFLRQTRYFQGKKVNCKHFNSLKHCEFFILLRHFCPRKDLVMFLMPLIGHTFNFRNKVLEKYMQCKDGGVDELASLVGMGRKNFEKQFQKEFGVSPAKWMLKEKANRLYAFLNEPEVTIADAMDEFYFNSSSHFNRFCRHFFNKTPGVIIKEARQQKMRKKK